MSSHYAAAQSRLQDQHLSTGETPASLDGNRSIPIPPTPLPQNGPDFKVAERTVERDPAPHLGPFAAP